MASPEPSTWRPFVILSTAVSLDGKLATDTGDTNLSNRKDWNRVHHLRMESDAIMVGGGTIRKDDSKLIVDEEKLGGPASRQPLRVVVSATGNIPLNARVITQFPEVPTLIAITTHCPIKQQQKLEDMGCQVIECGSKTLVDLSLLLKLLKTDFKVNRLMVEGGGKLNGSLLSMRLIDEIQMSYAPVIAGHGVPLFELSHPIRKFSESPFFEIRTIERIDDMFWIRVKIHYAPRELV